MGAILITTISSVVVVVLTAGLAYMNSRRGAERAARLDRVNAQLRELYGPLLAHASINRSAFAVFLQRYRAGQHLFPRDGNQVDPDLLETWKLWVGTVFMPANRAMVGLITTHTHLIEGDAMPDPFIHLLAHVSGYEVVLERWSRGDISQITSLLDHPGDPLDEYLSQTFAVLKARQQELLRVK